MVVWVESACNVVERAVFFCLSDKYSLDVEAIVHFEILGNIVHVEGIERCLSLAKRKFSLAELHYMVGMIGIHPECHSAVYNIFSKAEGKAYDAFLGLFIVDSIVVKRASHARDVRIEEVSELSSDNFLKNYRHLFLVDDVSGSSHVVLAVLIVDRCVDTLDGIAQHSHHLVLVVYIRNHIG